MLAVVLAGVVGWGTTGHLGQEPAATATDAGTTGAMTVAERPVLEPLPNLVLVLMDDFSLDLLDTMRHARRMERDGASYANAFVVDSLCCVSRSSLMTGQYPHQTGVLTNTANTPNRYGPIGGWEAFTAYGNQERSVNVRLQGRGYTTGFVGKYLNQYEPARDPDLPVPAGWDQWHALFGSAYDGWDFESTYVDHGRLGVRDHPAPPAWAGDEAKDAAYAGQVIEDYALDFIDEHAGSGSPYFLQVAPFAPHSRTNAFTAYPDEPLFPSAFRDRPEHGSPWGNCGPVDCQDLDARDLVGFGDDQSDNVARRRDGSRARDWKAAAPGLSAEAAGKSLRSRARMVQSIDRTLGRILAAVDDNTYVVLTSDNGFHLGQHGLERGKGTPYDSDVHVPLLVVGPGVAPGERTEVVNNIDLAPTFEELAGLDPAPYRSGRSLVPTLADRRPDRREFAFLEHTYAPSLGSDPDRSYSGGTLDMIPSYVAVRSRDALLVRLDLDDSWEGTDYAWEFYDYRDAPFERTNTVADPSKQAEVRRLRRALREFLACSHAVRDQRVLRTCR